MPFASSSARWTSPTRLLPLLAAALLAALWFGAPVGAHARSLVSGRETMSEAEARLLLARLYSYSEDTLALSETEYRRILQSRPTDKEAALELAQVLLRLGRRADADAILRTLDANDPRVAAGLGDALFASGRMAEAAEAYERALAAGSDRKDLRLRLAQSLSWSDQTGKALPYLAELHAADPGDTEAALLYARALTRTGDGAGARAILDRLAAADPDNAALLFELADQEAALGHLRDARGFALKALALDASTEAGMRAAQLMNQWGAFHRAAALRRDLLAKEGPNRARELALADTLANGQRYEQAEGVLRKRLLEDPADRAARLLLADVKVREKDGAATLAVLQPLADKAGDAEAEALRARGLELLGRYDEAAAAWARLGPDKPATLVERGRMLLRASDAGAAKDAFAEAARLAPDDPAARYYAATTRPGATPAKLAGDLAATETDPAALTAWAELFSRDGRYDAAVACLEAALARDAGYFPARMALAENLAYDHRYDESLAMLQALATDFPDSSKIALTRARVLAWSRRYDQAVAAYEALHEDDPADPVPLREMARTEFWDKRAEAGTATFGRLLEPPVDELLAERLEAASQREPDDAALAGAAGQARRSALSGGVFQAYLRLADSAVADSHPGIFIDLLPAYRIQHATALEQRAKLAAYNRRFAPAMDDLAALTGLQPGNEEAWFDLGQAQCALGLCREESATYARLLEIDPLHTLAGRALERRERRSAPRVRAGVNVWQEKGHGDVANIVRLRNDMQVSAPVGHGLRIEAAAHHWLESPQGPSSHYDALGGTLGLSGVFNEWLAGSASWTAKRFTSSAPRDTDQFRARVELNLRNHARLGMGFERVDEVANRFALLAGTQSDHFILDAAAPVTRRLDLEASARHIEYSDDNTGEMAHLAAGYALTDHPRILKVILRGEYRHTAKTSQDVYTGGELTDIIHPYWTPQGYTAGTVTLEWNEDMAKEFFCGAKRHFVDVKVSGGTDSDSNNAVRVEAKWVLDITDHWGVEASGLWHRSQQWDANGFWGGVSYGF
ncbi:tetratricopeptide repeat protein [Pseudodesulfovibrio sp.]|uniref:tetratricopeptide repeat protein n=1 Tax=Pseudodesulfovibrio sp. TaxID=2035812 RepID=UPI00261BFB57|nr:tetratricopeptide repeat protein [Pseudodesulfovibrio sp.]MDD3310770.1 tetratricopeptide repeat protein [Pseudodesulfovibrio sp.]